MNEEKRREIYGTPQPVSDSRCVRIGQLELLLEDGAVRGLYFCGVEVLRGLDYPVRDANWGTYDAETLDEDLQWTASSLRFRRKFRTGGGRLIGNFSIDCSDNGAVDFSFDLEVLEDMELNRAGFVILHPATFAGSPVRVTHSDGCVADGVFPSRISAGQPFFDIAGVSHTVNGVSASLSFEGEVFEMEDQRNWSDASYKTYCRPLGWQRPYAVTAGTRVQQSIHIVMSVQGEAQRGSRLSHLGFGALTGRPVPEIAFALQDGWQGTSPALEALADTPVLLRIDLTDDLWSIRLQATRQSLSGRTVDLEVVVSDDGAEAVERLQQLHAALYEATILPTRLTVLPAAYLISHQPDGVWPSGLNPVDTAELARSIFANCLIGGGVLTNFTELNRWPAAATVGDFVTHSTTAIVHAADDRSVMQSLEALPQIFYSAKTLAEGRPYRLGLVSIGMRSNPYGACVADNQARVRRPMAMDDPRQRGLFAAAYMVGAVASTQASSVESMALAAPAGPFGIADEHAIFPAYHAFLGLKCLSGLDRRILVTPDWCAGVVARGGQVEGMVLANLTAEPQQLHLPYAAKFVILDSAQNDPKWLAKTVRQTGDVIALGPYAVAFATSGEGDLFQDRP